MNYNNPFRKSAIALAVSSASVLASGFSGSAFAQEEDVADAAQLEVVTVTGSRIRRPDLDGASPVTVINRQELLETGITDIGDLIQSMPSMSGSPIGTTTNNGGNGAVLIDLRGLGTARTLTLVNGQRMVDGGDFQTIPSSMIERVEILKDGASAVYGADAVSGVVNIITRKDFEGVELSAQVAEWQDTEGAGQTTFGFIAGNAFDGGNFVFGAEHVTQDEAYQADTPWEYMKDSYYIYPEGCENNLLEPYPTGCFRIGSSRIPEGRFGFLSQGTFTTASVAEAPYQAALMTPFDGRNYNYAPVNYMQTPYERTNIFAEANFDLTDSVRFKTELRGNFRESAQELAPLPYATGPTGDPGYRGNFNGTAYNGVSEQNYYLRQAVDRYNAATGAGLVYEPVVDVRRRQIETTRRFEQEITQFQFVTALEGEFNDMNWSVFMNQGYRVRDDVDYGQFSGNRLSNALGPSADLDGDGRPECYGNVNDPSTLIQGCVPLNLFGGGTVVRNTGEITGTSLTQDMVDYVSVDLVDQYKNRQTVIGADIAGSMFELPAGEVGWAVGYQYWDQSFSYTPDSAKALGAATGNVGAGTNGDLTSNSVFAEVSVPLLDNGTQNLYIDAGVRYDDYDAFDAETTWQAKINFQVLDDVKLRATAGSVYRAPTISNLFGGLVDSFPTANDPCSLSGSAAIAPGCAQVAPQTDSQLRSNVGGNPNLRPESGETFTAGVVWTPNFENSDLSITLDYWDITLDDGISSLGAQAILDDCYVNLNQDACLLVTRNPDYSVGLILDAPLNLTEETAKGIDFEARYNFSTDIGQFEASFLLAHTLERGFRPTANDPIDDFAGRYTLGEAFAENKFNARLQWSRNDLSIGWLGEYIGKLEADTNCNCGVGNRPDGSYVQDIDAQMYHDLVVNYTVGDTGLSVAGGVTNLTDEEPPYIDSGFNGNTDPATYRLFGRGYYLRLNWKF
ncbi:TonB-dependent receptor [Arenicella chitinivorans]|uniref:TonB-dependent receptor n=1 Tax=Arenicella chitinivorans TaxID=1329800 RepID=A0A918VNH4_9GAMM|nr:TonB-dependent receptor [Arenicella chitinivorans]GHA11348.1 TonB-dependent receptor [Arenicella chitinivorans]